MWILLHLCQSNFCDGFNITDKILLGMKYLFSLYLKYLFLILYLQYNF